MLAGLFCLLIPHKKSRLYGAASFLNKSINYQPGFWVSLLLVLISRCGIGHR